ncbi:BTAD domain-containing putative transcriptional regulator [Armatimonas sp.]|uniref:AfsR/SARP family transcriptional regulator n=1 Tax=Armatimonas sp. TaxID=1872638 RepID=UPI00286BB5E2|nr:BTAD domain-containing putative transcriptional regulator [Armatimonas sp.]
MDTLLQVTLLGSLTATVMPSSGSSPITHFRTQKTAALFAYLAFHVRVPQSREELIARFWPESGLEQGRMSLRTALSSLRKDLGEALVTDKMSITLFAETDLLAFEQALHRARQATLIEVEKIGQLQEAVEHYGGPLLPGLYDDWIFPERDRLAEEQRAALSALAHWQEARGEPMRAIDFARRATILAPLDEDLRSELIRLLKATGQATEARRQFDDLTRLLEDQLGVKPSPATCALVAGLTESVLSVTVPARRLVHLPLSRGRFRGRREELLALVQRLAGGKSDSEGARLFTLFGPGGIGKTRLAIEAARRLVAHGLVTETYFISLATATTMEQVWDGIFHALELVRSGSLPPTTQVAARLQPGSCVLILDNLEQVALEAGEVATALLAEIPNLILLTTSRRRLGTPEETLIAVGALSEEEGVELFVDRARSVVPSFTPTTREREAIQTLVARLEGFPLAIELAAAWSSALTPSEMLTQLGAGLLTLPENNRSREERHSSLSATIRWSVELLSPELRHAFFALALFRGGWFPEASAAVCQVSRDSLASLRDRSLITAQAHGDTLRFSMHEALREFGSASLPASKKRAVLKRHATHFLTVAEQEKDPVRLSLEHANFQLALESSQGVLQTSLCQALAPFWDQQGFWREGRRWLEQALSGETTLVQKAELLHATARLCHSLCDAEATERYHRAARELALERGDDRGIGRALLGLAAIQAHYRANYTECQRLTEQAQEHFERADNISGQCSCLIGLGVLAAIQGNLDVALTHQTKSLALAEAAGENLDSAIAHHRLGITYLSLEEWEPSSSHLQAAEALMASLINPAGLAYIRVDLGTLAGEQGEPERAHSYYQSSLAAFRELGELWACALCLGNLARLARKLGKLRESAQYWAESLRLRLLLRDPFSMASGLDGATNLIFSHAATHLDITMGQDAVTLRTASTTWRLAHDAGEVDLEGCEEAEIQVRAALGELTCTSPTLEEATARALEILEVISA